jgi:hypothetical protein
VSEGEKIKAVVRFAQRNKASLGMVWKEDEPDEVMISLTWGREAPDSPMAGAASYGHGTLEEALDTVISECRIAPDGSREPR